MSSHVRKEGTKRSKRPRTEKSSGHVASQPHSERTKKTEKQENGDSDQEQNQNVKQRLYHGVCPDVSNRYRKVGGSRIGQGTYGVVYRARDVWKEAEFKRKAGDTLRNEKENEIVALKKCYAHHEASDGFPVTTLREIQALRICSSHPNIVDLLEIAVSSSNKSKAESENSNEHDDNSGKSNAKTVDAKTQKSTVKIGKSNVFLVFEHCRYDLGHILDSYHEYRRKSHRQNRGASSPFSLPQIKTLVLQLLSALEFCHSHWLVHRDIKPSNLLYDTTSGRLKVCDFGLSRTVSNGHMTPNVVSLWYRAPELLLSDAFGDQLKYSFPIDLWATGCVVAELLKGQPFMAGTTEIEQLEQIQDALGPPPKDLYSVPTKSKSNKHRSLGLWDRFEYLPPEGLTLLARLLDYDPKGRWTAAQALKADFLAPTSKPAPIEDLKTMPRGFPGC